MINKDVALVLSGGGARGIAHIGVIEVLEEHGYKIRSVAGTSMGAFVGAVYVLGKLPEFKEWITSIDKVDIFKLVDFTFSTYGFIKGERLFEELRKFIPNRDIEKLGINYTAIATDIMNKREIVFTQGPIFDAVRASISIPTVFTPVKTDSTLLVDGGTINNLPIDRVLRTPDDILVAVNVVANVPFYKRADEDENLQAKVNKFKKYLGELKYKKLKTSLNNFELIDKSVNLLIDQVIKAKLERIPPDIYIPISDDACGLFDFFKAQEIINIGREIAEEIIEEYESGELPILSSDV